MYRYRCDQCRTTSLPVRTRVEVLAERDSHRRRRHGGHVPDGEHIQRPRRRPADDLRPVLVAAVLLGLLLLALIAHH